MAKAKVLRFKPSGKYYDEDEWEIPTAEELERKQRNVERPYRHYEFTPTCMLLSKDFSRVSGTGAVLVVTQEPWGFPHLFPGIGLDKDEADICRTALGVYKNDYGWREDVNWDEVNNLINKLEKWNV